MGVSIFRKLFKDRAYRNIITIIVCLGINLVLMHYCPLWVLMLAPSILGIPHYIESLSSFNACSKDNPNEQNPRLINHSLLFISCIFLFLRLAMQSLFYLGFQEASFLILHNLRLLDLTIVCVGFAWFAYIYQISLVRRALGLVFLASFSYCLIAFGASIWGIFIFSHNFMAFYYWHFYAPTQKEKNHVLFFSLLFTLIHLFVLSPLLDDFLLNQPIDQRPTLAFGYSFHAISHELFPLNFDIILARKMVSLLCFGQSVHYILWIRIIPACRLQQKGTITFRKYIKNLIKNFGRPWAYSLLFLMTGYIFGGLFCPWNLINDLFFGLAFFHIYAEYLAWFLRFLRCNKNEIDDSQLVNPIEEAKP